jgi:hypothetical protein
MSARARSRLAPLALAVIATAATIALSACSREITCTTQVTEGRGTFRGTAIGARPEADLRREALRVACGALCEAGAGKTDACVSRCTVDVQSQKIGARTTCEKKKQGAASR